MPQVSDGPKKLNELLEQVYQQCIVDGGSESSCSKIAWDAAKKAGWNKTKEGWKLQKSIWGDVLNVGK